MKELKVKGQTGKSRILVGMPLVQLQDFCNLSKTVVITDQNVLRFHRSKLPNCPVIEIGLGEVSKTLQTVNMIYEKLMELNADRGTFVLAIGGGIVSDVAGYASSTYLRGLKFGFVPTTLLAQVDASIGGKNGVNFKGYKNLIGTINQPDFVFCDISMLKTLPLEEIKNGYAEVIKHAAIADPNLFTYLEKKSKAALSMDEKAVEKIIYNSIKIKAKIVEKDEKEKGERRKLNFGHTIGHAVEKVCGLRHGEAVSIGMAAAAKLSVQKGLLENQDAQRLESLLKEYGLPVSMNASANSIIDAMEKDKKRENTDIKFVLLTSLGNAVVEPISMNELRDVVNDMCEHS
ncbi:3-dehydroquinate synthase [Candidatus Micrarchaeota archaeon]|nr:3-dehydroquinate synthase [Candidatus Micrarchaeota archaeon]